MNRAIAALTVLAGALHAAALVGGSAWLLDRQNSGAGTLGVGGS